MPTASKLIYELQQQMQALDPWATSVQIAITDHAKLIDRACDQRQGQHIASNIAFEKLHAELVASTGRHDLAESDLRRVHDEGAERNLKLRTELDKMTAEIASEAQKVADGHAQLTSSVATLALKMG